MLSDLKGLGHAKTDHAKARAWLRLAINEHSLESYLSSAAADSELLGTYYEPHAYLRDEEQIGVLQALLAGISFTMKFDIVVDDASLDCKSTDPVPLVC